MDWDVAIAGRSQFIVSSPFVCSNRSAQGDSVLYEGQKGVTLCIGQDPKMNSADTLFPLVFHPSALAPFFCLVTHQIARNQVLRGLWES
jgi:hypothetical protein